MTTVSATTTFNTAGEYQDLETITGITLTTSAKYSIQVQNLIHFKVADADYLISNKEFTYTHGSDIPTIKTETREATITILENAS